MFMHSIAALEADNKIRIWKTVSREDEHRAVLPETPGHTYAVHTQPCTRIHAAAFPKPGTNIPRATKEQKTRATILHLMKDWE